MNNATPSRQPPVFPSYTDDATGPRVTADQVHDAYAKLGLTTDYAGGLIDVKRGRVGPLQAVWLAGEGSAVDVRSLDPESDAWASGQAAEWAEATYGRQYYEGFRFAWNNPTIERHRLTETTDRSWSRRVDEGAEDGWRAAVRCRPEFGGRIEKLPTTPASQEAQFVRSTTSIEGRSSMIQFAKATRKALRLRAAIDGPAGSGKTFTGLRFAHALGKRVAVISSESGAVEKYLGLAPDGTPFDFDICYLPDFSPTSYTQAILAAGQARYDVLLIDSLSHAWAGDGGALEIVNRAGGNSYTAWKDVTPMHNKMIEAILRSPCHVIATMRSKTEYVLEAQVNKSGQTVQVPKKVGMAPVQRAGMEYEFDIYCSLDADTHVMRVTKTRCPAIDGMVVVKPGADFIAPVVAWLAEGVEVPADFYAVKEGDLKAVAAAVEADKSEEERAAERKAKAGEKAAAMAAAQAKAGAAGAAQPAAQQPAKPAATTTPANTPPANPLFAPITDSDKATIKEVITHKGIGESEIAAAMVRAIGSAKKLSTLTRSEAAAFHAELLLVGEAGGAAADKPADQPASTPTTPASQAAGAAGSAEQPAQPTGHTGDQLMDRPAPAEPTPTEPANGKPGWSTTPGSATPAQCARIRELAKLTNWEQEGPGGIKEALTECKAANVRGLSESQAAAIIGKREAVLAGAGAGTTAAA